MAQDAPAYYNPFGTTANPKYNPYAGPGNDNASGPPNSTGACHNGHSTLGRQYDAGCAGQGEEEKKTGGATGGSGGTPGRTPGTSGGGGPMGPLGSPPSGGGGPGAPGAPPAGPEGGPEGSPFEFPPFPGGQPPGGGGPSGGPEGGGGSPYSMMGLDQAGGEQMLSAPSSLRQGIGTRIQPQLSMALAGLKRIY